MTKSIVKMHYALIVLCGVNLFYYADRFVIYILVEPIRNDLGLSDVDVGVITGVAFSLTYVLLLVPIGRLTDRTDRTRFLGLCVTIWCCFTALCGLAQNYTQLILARIGVAGGEAGGVIPAQSIIADSYGADTRGRANAFYMSSANFGKLLAFAAAGFLNDLIGWRMTFVVIGLCGLFLGPLLFYTVPEPARGGADGLTPRDRSIVPWRDTISQLLSRKSLIYLITGYAFVAMAHYSVLSWLPSFIIRRFELGTSETGLLVAAATVVPTLIGVLLGGVLSDLAEKRGTRYVPVVSIVAAIIACPGTILMVTAPSLTTFVLYSVPPAMMMGMYSPPLLSSIQSLAGVKLRGMGVALLLVGLMLVGQGIGPAVSGGVSTWITTAMPNADSHLSLQLALQAMSVFFVVGCMPMLFAIKHMNNSLEKTTAFDRGETSYQ